MSTQITDAPRAPRNGTSHGSGDDPGRLVGSRPLPTRARRPGLIGAAIALIVGFALTGALLVSSAGGKTEVLVAAHAVPAGHVLTGEDLRATGVAGDVRAIAATDLSTVVGRTSAVDLAAGQLLNRDMLTDIPVPGAGQALVGLALAPGRFPADGLQPGDQVQAIEVPTAAGAGADLGSPRLLALGEVYALRADGTSAADTLITVLVPSTAGGRLSAYGAAGQVALIKISHPASGPAAGTGPRDVSGSAS